jgi:ribosome recycling factor
LARSSANLSQKKTLHTMDLKKTIADGANSMKKAVEWTQSELATLHTGKASPSMVENINVHIESYGMSQRLKDMSAITTPDARSITVTPFDKAVMEDIRKAIQSANIGINPIPQGNFLRCPVPELTGERRVELAKVAHQRAEEGRVRIRNARRDCLESIKKAHKDKLITDDDLKRAEKEVQASTDAQGKEIDRIVKAKEVDLGAV